MALAVVLDREAEEKRMPVYAYFSEMVA